MLHFLSLALNIFNAVDSYCVLANQRVIFQRVIKYFGILVCKVL